MFRITNNSGAHIPLGELDLGPHQSRILNSIPTIAPQVRKFVTIEEMKAPMVSGFKPEPVKPVSKPEPVAAIPDEINLEAPATPVHRGRKGRAASQSDSKEHD